ncbi:ras-related and estrogen-regulated growth inhibitor isoform X2 [Lycorma delicatula]|uniref:ras-related and estrogen-regulated growth inhibitor isoform X2 n=1 Tax=Lycorma delicatula TaxID=130591 RepID=UPI003F50E899
MTSNAIRGIRRKKSSLSEVKVAVIGAPGVGKSALTVRFLTRRYIGEYDHQAETRYKHEVLVDGEPVLFEILDSCPKGDDEFPSNETINWADGCLLVYAITDRRSFNYVRRAKQLLSETPLVLVGNKGDMVHLRQVSTEEVMVLSLRIMMFIVQGSQCDEQIGSEIGLNFIFTSNSSQEKNSN